MTAPTKKPPRYLYHASPECVFTSILKEGLRSSWEGVYASEDPQHSLRFMGFRLIDHYHGSKPFIMPDGSEVLMPEIVHHDAIHVWKIDTTKLPQKWEVGADHSAFVFGDATSWLYPETIPHKAIVSYDTYGRNDED